ncbi:hypothetical protein [Flavobacterium sp. KMS]|uniref:hypothetical protein n=1 Tax=unclassified Flavobacterium TaxID=196869 RepID=UPI000B2998E8|nr:hypothetical protein [Flavobacterium sp. KMS]
MKIHSVILLAIFFILISCRKRDGNLEKKNYNDVKKDKILLEFNPHLITKLDLINTDSIILEDFYKNKKISSKWVSFRYKNKVDTAYTLYKEAKYYFQLKKNFVQKHDYKLIINIKDKKNTYFFENIDYDSIRNGKTIYFVTKSYMLNKKKYGSYDAVYYLE